jgi:hypothetical protein
MKRVTTARTSGGIDDERWDGVMGGGTELAGRVFVERRAQTDSPGFSTAPFGTMMIPLRM